MLGLPVLAAAIVAASTGAPPAYSGADLVCVDGGAHFQMWQGAQAAPVRALNADVRVGEALSVDVAAWTSTVSPLDADKAPADGFTLEIVDSTPGSSLRTKAAFRCAAEDVGKHTRFTPPAE
jgi:hypothetical protein